MPSFSYGTAHKRVATTRGKVPRPSTFFVTAIKLFLSEVLEVLVAKEVLHLFCQISQLRHHHVALWPYS